MASLNKVLFIGNLTADPELKNTQSGKSVCNFSIAVNRAFAPEGQPTVDFFNVVVWNKAADFVASYFKKGDPIFVLGQLQNRSWSDQQGQKHYTVEILADEVSFVKSKGESSAESVKSDPRA